MQNTDPQSIPPRFPTIHPIQQLKINIAQESLRQASKSFDLACRSFQLSLTMTAISGTIGFIGVGLLLSGQASEGTVTTAGGLASSVCFWQISKDSQTRLEKANARLDKIRTELIETEVDACYFPYLSSLANASYDLPGLNSQDVTTNTVPQSTSAETASSSHASGMN